MLNIAYIIALPEIPRERVICWLTNQPLMKQRDLKFHPDKQVTFDSEDGTLEGMLTTPEEKGPIGTVVCHPHPLYGGTMDNLVVRDICKALADRGRVVLRFNFRGVGKSQGAHGGGIGEIEDVLSALGFLRGTVGVEEVDLAGYSFGSMMALRASLRDRSVKRIACVALPVDHYDETNMRSRPDLKVLLVGGDKDDLAPLEGIERFAEALGDQGRVEVVRGADHFFGGRTATVAGLVADILCR